MMITIRDHPLRFACPLILPKPCTSTCTHVMPRVSQHQSDAAPASLKSLLAVTATSPPHVDSAIWCRMHPPGYFFLMVVRHDVYDSVKPFPIEG